MDTVNDFIYGNPIYFDIFSDYLNYVIHREIAIEKFEMEQLYENCAKMKKEIEKRTDEIVEEIHFLSEKKYKIHKIREFFNDARKGIFDNVRNTQNG